MSTSTLIVCGAPVSDSAAYTPLIQAATHLIAVDSGGDLCRQADRTPDVLVGDMDSISLEGLEHATSKGVDIRQLPVDKDITDLDAALAVAHEIGFRRANLTAVFGGRLDHTLAAVGSIASSPVPDLSIWERELDGWLLQPEGETHLILPGNGDTVSVFALAEETRVTLRGFRYPLKNQLLDPLSSLGLSNVTEPGRSSVTVHSGRVLVVRSRTA